MITITFSELCNETEKYLNAVEAGETVEVSRHGKPVVVLSPAALSPSKTRWREAKAVCIDGVSLSRTLLDERRESQ